MRDYTSEKKKSGNTVCEPEVRRAITFAQYILRRAQAVALGFDSSEKCQSDGTIDLTGDNKNPRRTSKKVSNKRLVRVTIEEHLVHVGLLEPFPVCVLQVRV